MYKRFLVASEFDFVLQRGLPKNSIVVICLTVSYFPGAQGVRGITTRIDLEIVADRRDRPMVLPIEQLRFIREGHAKAKST